jgi:RNA polymerase sigma-70 factor (ECF subfamily)
MTVEIALESIVRRHQDGLRRYLRLLGCDAATADDLAQEAFVSLLTGRFEERAPAATASWLRMKARWLWLDRRRRLVRRREVRYADAADRVWCEVAPDGDEQAYFEALDRCLAGLPPRSRRAIDLRYGEKRSRAEMAELLKLRENGVKTLLQRVRASLRRCIEERIRT